MHCIATENLSYCFSKKEPVITNINLLVPEGAVYGFLGPNGAGKTTTLRLLTGLLKKQQGQISIFNKSLQQHRIDILKNTGCLIEYPSIYSHLTAKENLAVWQKLYQCPAANISGVLDTVGLSATANKKAGKFSLGMKQRLGIAIALLHDPALLILDEPTNGLDPNGIIEIRELIVRLNKEYKKTILISSHLLTEIERLATDVGIINKGQLVFQGTLLELKQKQRQSAVTMIDTNDISKTMAVISSTGIKASAADGSVSVDVTDKKIIAKINQHLVNNNIEVYQIVTSSNDLESIFMDLINN